MSALSLQKAIVILSLCFGLLPTTALAETVLTLHATVDTFPDRDITVTVDTDGTISTEVELAPDPDDMEIPDGLVPDDAQVDEIDLKGTGENGMFNTVDEVKQAVALAIAAYLIAENLRVLAQHAESDSAPDMTE